MASRATDDLTETGAPDLTALVGARVRAARIASGAPRRALSERSGVSPRYLAQLEAGEGNISIRLLDRVARALGRPVGWFLAEPRPTDEAADFTRLYEAATPEARRRALACLGGGAAEGKAQRVCLIGLRGAGKSTLGRMAAEALGCRFIELTDEIEARAGMAVAEVVALNGPEGYRRLEAEALTAVAARHDRAIVAAAGGVTADAETYEALLARFHTVWIKAAPEEHMERVRRQGDLRPMAGNPEAMAQLRALLARRAPLYARADAALDTEGRAVDQSLGDLTALIRARGFLGDQTAP